VINFTDPEDNRYSYRIIDDADSTWHDLNTQSTIGLNNLAAGTYNIEVKLSSVNNRWPEQTKNLSIVIVPPFWKTKWFIAGAVVLLFGLFYLFYRYRINQVRKKAELDKIMAQTEMKALHAQMNPHFIFNCLNSIREMILNNENKQASHYLNKFAQLIRITLNQSSKPFVSLQNTIDYLQRYIEMEKIRATNFTHSIEVDDSLNQEDILLPPMLIQPFIENSIWHGVNSPDQPMKIDIRFKKEHQQLLCTIEDDGIGIERSLKLKEEQLGHNSVGIDNIKQRIKVLNEKYNLQSSVTIEDKSNQIPKNPCLPDRQGTGTIVKLRLPIKNTAL
jgi:LytS/YehU family sensor histidine kinase